MKTFQNWSPRSDSPLFFPGGISSNLEERDLAFVLVRLTFDLTLDPGAEQHSGGVRSALLSGRLGNWTHTRNPQRWPSELPPSSDDSSLLPFLNLLFFSFRSPLCRPYAFPALWLFLLPPSCPLSPFSSCPLSLPLPSSSRLVSAATNSTAPGSLEASSADPSPCRGPRGPQTSGRCPSPSLCSGGGWDRIWEPCARAGRSLGPSPCPPRSRKSRGLRRSRSRCRSSRKPAKCDGVPAPRSPSTSSPGAAAPGYPTSCGSSWNCGWMLQLQETQLRGRLLCWERRRRCNIFKVSQTLWLHWPPWSWRQTELMFYTFGYRFEFSPPHAKYLKPLETHDLTINDCAILSI
ncbi:uncharacterized protein LOC122747896 [Dromiciops gliroides]|uniref:uncharacterized protein LOC122747896 n=1 Tax=Dromiciops gliroides TaxID=33562 RepID=UPI001CC427D2|nr:uncharacterized protein LOC122747896 [Dromiciops gliroides]